MTSWPDTYFFEKMLLILFPFFLMSIYSFHGNKLLFNKYICFFSRSWITDTWPSEHWTRFATKFSDNIMQNYFFLQNPFRELQKAEDWIANYSPFFLQFEPRNIPWMEPTAWHQEYFHEIKLLSEMCTIQIRCKLHSNFQRKFIQCAILLFEVLK